VARGRARGDGVPNASASIPRNGPDADPASAVGMASSELRRVERAAATEGRERRRRRVVPSSAPVRRNACKFEGCRWIAAADVTATLQPAARCNGHARHDEFRRNAPRRARRHGSLALAEPMPTSHAAGLRSSRGSPAPSRPASAAPAYEDVGQQKPRCVPPHPARAVQIELVAIAAGVDDRVAGRGCQLARQLGRPEVVDSCLPGWRSSRRLPPAPPARAAHAADDAHPRRHVDRRHGTRVYSARSRDVIGTSSFRHTRWSLTGSAGNR
jgi:hypothetical protein